VYDKEYYKQYRLKNKEVIKEYGRQYYLKNKERIYQRVKIFREKNKDNVNAVNRIRINKKKEYKNKIKLERGCAYCGYNENVRGLIFDHIDPSTKTWNVSNMPDYSYERIDEEIAKCQVLCGTCHLIKTYSGTRNNCFLFLVINISK